MLYEEQGDLGPITANNGGSLLVLHGDGADEVITIETKEFPEMVKVLKDGTVRFGEGYTPDAAATAFWEAIASTGIPVVTIPDHTAADTVRTQILDDLIEENKEAVTVKDVKVSSYTALELTDGDGKRTLTVHLDGTVDPGEGIELDDASARFWDGFKAFCPFPQLVRLCSEVSFRGPDLAAGLNLKNHQEWINSIGALVEEIDAVMPKKES